MPEIRFVVRWPDETITSCYSPSLVICEHLEAGARYAIPDFVERSRKALAIASDRIREKYGLPCSLAAAEIARIDRIAATYGAQPEGVVTIESFEPEDARS